VVYDPLLRVPVDVFPCEDGHAQERCLLKEVLATVARRMPGWGTAICARLSLPAASRAGGRYLLSANTKIIPGSLGKRKNAFGACDTGTVYEQRIVVWTSPEKEYPFRRIRIKLKKETRDGEKEIAIITNASPRLANGQKIADLYHGRWKIETAFQELTRFLNSEISTLGYPRAALFGFCVALVAYMILSVVKAAIEGVHGKEAVRESLRLLHCQ